MSRGIVVCLLLSGALKVLLAVVFTDIPPRYDEVEFLEFGRRVAAGESPVLWRAPGYQSFVAVGLLASGGHTLGVRLLQVLLSVATTWVLYRLALRVTTPRAALAAAAFVAFYPSHVAFSHLLWAETLFTFVALLAFDRLLRASDDGTRGAAVAAGVLLGAAVLVRSAGLPLLLASIAWSLLASGRRVRTVALAVSAAAVIAPWSLHASLRAGRFVLVDTNPGWNLWSGNNEYVAEDLQGIWGTGLPLSNGTEEALGDRLIRRGIPAGFAGRRPEGEWRRILPERLAADRIVDRSSPEADAWFRRQALAEMQRDPVGVIARAPLKLAGFWSPDFFLPRHVLRDWYGPAPPAAGVLLLALTWIAALVPLVVGPYALVGAARSSWAALALAWLVALLAVHALLFGVSRMHQPLVPLLVLAAAARFLRSPRDNGGHSPSVRRVGVVAAGAALLLMLLSLPAVTGVYLAPGPRHVATARLLGTVRHLPLPGARHAAYMLAEVEAANGNGERARGALDAVSVDDAGAMYLRALVADTREERHTYAGRATAALPDSRLLRALNEVP